MFFSCPTFSVHCFDPNRFVSQIGQEQLNSVFPFASSAAKSPSSTLSWPALQTFQKVGFLSQKWWHVQWRKMNHQQRKKCQKWPRGQAWWPNGESRPNVDFVSLAKVMLINPVPGETKAAKETAPVKQGHLFVVVCQVAVVHVQPAIFFQSPPSQQNQAELGWLSWRYQRLVRGNYPSLQGLVHSGLKNSGCWPKCGTELVQYTSLSTLYTDKGVRAKIYY